MRIDRTKVFLLCAEQGLDFKDVAKLMGVTPATVYVMVNRKSNRPTTFAKLADALGCNVKDLIAEE